MSVKKTSTQAISRATTSLSKDHDGVLRELMSLIESARRAAARSVNAARGPAPPTRDDLEIQGKDRDSAR